MKNIFTHPAEFLPPVITNEIRKEASAAELDRFLTHRQRQIIFDQNWLNMYVPKEFGGLQLTLPEILQIEEGLAWADGSTAWVVTLCSGAAWFVGFLDPALSKLIFAGKNSCLAGSGAVTGTAIKHGDKYVVNGFWKYATGSPMATFFTMNCQIIDNGSLLLDADGILVTRSFVLERDQVQIRHTWNAMGMIATGSQSFEVENAVVPARNSFMIHPKEATLQDFIFQYPFLQLAEATLAINLSGMAKRFLDLSQEIVSARNDAATNEIVLVANNHLDDLRKDLYFYVGESWTALTVAHIIPDKTLGNVSNTSHALVCCARNIVNELYPLCGIQAADISSEINRVWRNFHTAAQHSLFGSRASIR